MPETARRITVVLPARVADAVLQQAKREDRSLAGFIRRLLTLQVESCGDTRLAESMLPDGYTITRTDTDPTNGRIDDEFREIVETLGAISQADARGELHIGRESADKLIRAAMSLREEFKKRMQ